MGAQPVAGRLEGIKANCEHPPDVALGPQGFRASLLSSPEACGHLGVPESWG